VVSNRYEFVVYYVLCEKVEEEEEFTVREEDNREREKKTIKNC
jgi:hypothetical protein